MVRGHSPTPADPLPSMPASPSAVAAATIVSAGPHSKRDKRRSLIADRISEFSSEFNSNLRQHYDAQASAIQVDMSLILQTNPYDGPLPDDEESVVKTVYEDFLGGKSVVDPSAEADFVSTVGKWYQQFIRDVNRKMEERDANLAMLTVSLCVALLPTGMEILPEFQLISVPSFFRFFFSFFSEKI